MHMSKFIKAWIFNRFQRYFFSFALLVLKSVSLNATVTYLLPVPIATVIDIVPQKYTLNLIYSPIRKLVFLDLLLFNYDDDGEEEETTTRREGSHYESGLPVKE